MSIDALLLALAGPTVAFATLAYTIWSQRRKANADQLAKMEAKVATKADAGDVAAIDERVRRSETRLTQIEGHIETLPGRDATHRLELSLAEMRGDLKALTERIGPMAATSARLQEFLLEQAR